MDLAVPVLQSSTLRLDEGALSFWRPGERRVLDRSAFWDLVADYAGWIEAQPAVGDFGLIVSKTAPEMTALFVAMITMGRKVSFFPPSSSRQDADYYLEQQREAVLKIGPSCILVPDLDAGGTMGRIDPRLADLMLPYPRLDPARSGASAGRGGAAREAFAAALADPGRLLFWQHSSGTTGIKKAVGVTSAMLTAQLAGYWPVVEAALGGSAPCVASWLPLYHDMGLLAAFLLPLLAGSEIAYVDPFDWIDEPGLFLEMIEAEGSNLCWMPNFAFRHFTRLKPALVQRDLSSLKLWVSCSEPCRFADALAFERAFAGWGVPARSVVGCYAMAETVFAVSQLVPEDRRALVAPRDLKPGEALAARGCRETTEADFEPAPDRHAVLSSGQAIPGLEAAVFVDGAAADREGIYGEIGVRGECVFGGYRSMSAAESNIRPDGFYMTGDLGAVIGGRLYVFGRTKEIVIVNGKNLYAGDIEDRVNAVEGLRKGRVTAFGVENERTGSEDLVVVAEKEPSSLLSDAELRTAVITAVSDAFLVTPYDVRVVEDRWLVKSTSGKISRDQNRIKYLRDFRG